MRGKGMPLSEVTMMRVLSSFAAFFEGIEDLAQVFVEPFDFKGIVEHVVFYVFGCRPGRGGTSSISERDFPPRRTPEPYS